MLGDERGTTAIEYSLIAALIAMVIVSGLTLLSDDVDGLWGRMVDRASPALVSAEGET